MRPSRMGSFGVVAAMALGWGSPPVTRAEPAPPCASDAALSEAAVELLLAGAPLTGETLQRSAWAAGSDAPLLHGLRVRAEAPERVATWLGSLRAAGMGPWQCGEARNADHIVVLAREVKGGLERDPRHDRRFRVTLGAGQTKPRVVVQPAGSAPIHIGEFDARGWFEVPEDVDPPFSVQLVAEGPDGPRPVAERRVGAWPASPVVPGGEGDVPPDVNGWVARLRADAGAAVVRPNRLLKEVAARHATAVCALGRAAHRLDESGDPKERLRAEGIEARIVGEAVVRADSVSAAIVALQGSPSHAAALLDGRFTDVGVGVVEGPEACVSVLLAAWPRAVPRRAKP